jgi:hypothetical protein
VDLLGEVSRVLFLLREYLEEALRPSEGSSQIKKWKKENFRDLTLKSAEITRIAGFARKGKAVNKILKFGENENIRTEDLKNGTNVVYVRWNLINNATYVGETEHFEQRAEQHYMNTLKHEKESAVKKCLGCTEHNKYVQHRPIKAHEWFMTPVKTCKNREEAKLMEKMIIRKVGPSLNRKTLWCWKRTEQNYNLKEREACKKKRRDERNKKRSGLGAPWKRDTQKTQPMQEKKQKMSVFRIEGVEGKFYSLESVLQIVKEMGDTAMCKYSMGNHNVTTWRRIKRWYGDTELLEDEKCQTVTEWCDKMVNTNKVGEFKILSVRKQIPMGDKEFAYKLKIEDGLSKLSDEELKTVWTKRKLIKDDRRGFWIKKIWDELEIRHQGLTRQAITLKIPYVEGNDAGIIQWFLTNQILPVVARENQWPKYIEKWHKQNMRIMNTGRKNIGEVMINANKPYKFELGCTCRKVHAQMKKLGMDQELPKSHHHIFFIGRDYEGPYNQILQSNANTVPKPTIWDMKRVWMQVKNQLPDVFKEEVSDEWWEERSKEYREYTANMDKSQKVNTGAMYKLRKGLEGLVCGPIDKNTGELWFACPTLYNKAVETMYNTKDGGYEKVYPCKVNNKKVNGKKKAPAAFVKETLSTNKPPTKYKGGEKQIIDAWSKLYRQKKWNTVAAFNKKGTIGTPYILFKAKHITDKEKREKNLFKARPITPTWNHPMKRILGLVGRALYFIVNQWKGEHFIIKSTWDVPNFFKEVMQKFKGNDIVSKVLDIEGCYPNMPKNAIREGISQILDKARECGKRGVSVPGKGKVRKCSWNKCEGGFKWISFELIWEMLNFSLENAVLKLKDGRFIRQVKGIPMGDAISPAMTIGACAWMEKKWMEKLPKDEKSNFLAKRYMDDVLIFMKKHNWDRGNFEENFKNQVYDTPLCLKESEEGIFLESFFKIKGDYIFYRIKNANENGERNVWRYQHAQSYMPLQLKISLIVMTLKKVDALAGQKSELYMSGKQKLEEFKKLGYGPEMRQHVCYRVGRETGHYTWYTIGQQQV